MESKTPLVIKFYIDSQPPCRVLNISRIFSAGLTHAIGRDKFLHTALTLFIYREDFCVKTSLLNVDIFFSWIIFILESKIKTLKRKILSDDKS